MAQLRLSFYGLDFLGWDGFANRTKDQLVSFFIHINDDRIT